MERIDRLTQDDSDYEDTSCIHGGAYHEHVVHESADPQVGFTGGTYCEDCGTQF